MCRRQNDAHVRGDRLSAGAGWLIVSVSDNGRVCVDDEEVGVDNGHNMENNLLWLD
jgi:hypothetical protein